MNTMSNIKIYQIYYDQHSKSHLDSGYIPFDNTENPFPGLREYYVWKVLYEKFSDNMPEYWGAVSWKLYQKLNLKSNHIFDIINANPGFDIYFFNPFIDHESLFFNVWEQGDFFHGNLSEVANEIFRCQGFSINVNSIPMTSDNTLFTNSFIANSKFWKGFMQFVNLIFIECESNPLLKSKLFDMGTGNYSQDQSLCMFPFIIERLVPTYCIINKLKIFGFKHTKHSIHEKYKDFFDDINTISNIKKMYVKYNDIELFYCWNHLRNNTNSALLSLIT